VKAASCFGWRNPPSSPPSSSSPPPSPPSVPSPPSLPPSIALFLDSLGTSANAASPSAPRLLAAVNDANQDILTVTAFAALDLGASPLFRCSKEVVVHRPSQLSRLQRKGIDLSPIVILTFGRPTHGLVECSFSKQSACVCVCVFECVARLAVAFSAESNLSRCVRPVMGSALRSYRGITGDKNT